MTNVDLTAFLNMGGAHSPHLNRLELMQSLNQVRGLF